MCSGIVKTIRLIFRREAYSVNIWNKEPDADTKVVLARMRGGLARHKCKVCGDEFWVWGNPRKISKHGYPVCRKWSCYKEYFGERA